MVVNRWRHDAAGANGRWSRSSPSGGSRPGMCNRGSTGLRRSTRSNSPVEGSWEPSPSMSLPLCTGRSVSPFVPHPAEHQASFLGGRCRANSDPLRHAKRASRGGRRGVVRAILLASGPVVANMRPPGASGVNLVQRLELFRRYLRLLDVPTPLRAACAATGGGRLPLLILGPFYVGPRAISTVLRRA
jgi:hypothetical protein